MIVEDNKIIECTNLELFKHYLEKEWDDIYPYDEFKRRCIELGTIIREKDEE